ncbi:hypothetical protein WJS89_05110 [Sphingomicrobium sp. XHP0235]|uniref:hypothetical protein n=1 Tax=Sphingomicrobium aquimarinum TaxID=3133971 RepID=UPI0031FEFCC9
MLAAILLMAASPQLVIERIEWVGAQPHTNLFVEMLPDIDPTDADDLSDERNHQALAHVGRSDVIASRSTFHERRACRTDDRLTQADLVGRAAATRLVIINEAHVAPWHRATTAALLEPLKAAGYTHFAAETFARRGTDGPDPIVRHESEPHVRRTDGTYFEPHFGHLVETAKRLDYRLVAYEEHGAARDEATPYERVAARETAQARDLAAVLAADPSAKMLVHVGHGHVAEDASEWDEGVTMDWMARRLAAATGIDPLTISQTDCTGDAGAAPRILVVPDDVRPFVGTDLAIETAPPADFRVRRDDAVEFCLPASWRAPTGWTLVEVLRAGDPDVAIPVDWLAVHASEDAASWPKLSAPPGRYRIRLRPLGGASARSSD